MSLISELHWACGLDHHGQWLIDQIVRICTDCPVVDLKSKFKDSGGNYPIYKGYGESDKYKEWASPSKDEDGEWSEGWDGGTPP